MLNSTAIEYGPAHFLILTLLFDVIISRQRKTRSTIKLELAFPLTSLRVRSPCTGIPHHLILATESIAINRYGAFAVNLILAALLLLIECCF